MARYIMSPVEKFEGIDNGLTSKIPKTSKYIKGFCTIKNGN